MWSYVASGLLSFCSIAAMAAVILLHHTGQLRYANGEWSFLFLLVLVVPGMMWFQSRQRNRMLRRLGTAKNLKTLLPAEDPGSLLFARTALTAAVFFSVLSLLGPQMGTKLETVRRKGVDIFLAIDTSKSMDAEDIRPSRMERARMQIQDFVDGLEGDRVGLIAFAGSAFIQCPLTLDYGAVKIFLDVLDTSLIPVPGTDLGEAIREAMEGFSRKERKHKAMILFTDGEDHGGRAEEMAKQASEEGVVIYTIGIGSPEGSVIPVKDERGGASGFKKDEEGKVITSRLDETVLQKIALTTGGKYFRATSGEMELKRIYNEIQKMEKKDLGSAEMIRFENRYQYFLFPAVLFLFLASYFSLPGRRSS